MVDIFLAYRPGAAEWRDRILGATQALREIDAGESYPVNPVSDAPEMSDADWQSEIGPKVDEADLVLLLATADADGGYTIEPALCRAVDRARAGKRKIIPVIVDDMPGFLGDLGVAETHLLSIPEGGAGVFQRPFDGDRRAWLEAVVRGIGHAVRQVLERGQRPARDILAAARACRDAADAVRDAAQREAERLTAGTPIVLAAPDSVDAVLRLDAPRLLKTPRRLTREARRFAEAAGATETADALLRLTGRLEDLGDAFAEAGRPEPPETEDRSNWIDPLDVANITDRAELSVSATRAESDLVALSQATTGSNSPAARSIQAEIPIAEASLQVVRLTGAAPADGRRSRLPSSLPGLASVDPEEVTPAADQLENAFRALDAIPKRGLSQRTRSLISAAREAVRLVGAYVRRLVARAAGQPVPAEPDRTRPGALWRDEIPGVGPEGWPVMVTLPRGRFTMGSPDKEGGRYDDESPQHDVTIRHVFAIGRDPVTFAQWDAARAAGARLERGDDEGWGRGGRPVINVSLEDAHAYLVWLNDRLKLTRRVDAYRLPSEAEWEYACRAGQAKPYSFGEKIDKTQANFKNEKTTPVGQFPANALGLYDMHGNVWEWCEDTWHDTYAGAPDDGSVWEGGDASRRVVRGGSWNNDPQDLRSAQRLWDYTSDRSGYLGFRLARTLSLPKS